MKRQDNFEKYQKDWCEWASKYNKRGKFKPNVKPSFLKAVSKMKSTRDVRKNDHSNPDSNGKPSEEKIESTRKRLLKEYSEAWEELADH